MSMKISPAQALLVSLVLIPLTVLTALFISVGERGYLYHYIVLAVLASLIVAIIFKVRADLLRQQADEIKFRDLLNASPDAMVIVNDKGLIEMVNLQTENLFGYTRQELVGKPVEVLMEFEVRQMHQQHRLNYARAPKVRSMGVGLELKALKKNGVPFPVEISLSPMESKSKVLVSASIRDITHRKTLENELKRSNAEVEAFTYSVSHDLRAPLRGIIGFTTILEEDYASKLDDEAKRIASVIKTNALKMGRLIDDLLNFSRMGRQDIIKTRINMQRMVTEITEELAPRRQYPAINWQIGQLSPIEGDIALLRQVWINLVSNAVKYSARHPSPEITISSYPENGQVVYFIRDNGVGFDPAYKDKLFKVFQRLHSAEEFEGSGVGLALVEKIIAKHGGTIWATGEPGKGSSFYFSLPAA